MTQPASCRALIVSQYASVQAGGAERYISEVARRLPTHGIQVQQLAADCGEDRGQLSRARAKFATSSFHPAWAAEFRALLRRERPDVIYAHHTVPGLVDVAVRVARAEGIPAALMYHSDITGPSALYRLVGKTYDALVGRGTLDAADEVHVGTLGYVQFSDALRNLRKPFVEAPPGVDAVMMQGQRKTGQPSLLFVGKPDVPTKGFLHLLDAWTHLKAAWPELQLKVVGESTQTLQRPGLTWLGQVNSRTALADLYASATLTVLPSSSSESFGMVLAEALVAGSPVTGSRVGGLPALIDEGVTGFLAQPGDVSSLIDALARGLKENDHLRNNVQERRAANLARFDWDATATHVAQSLHRLNRRTP